MREDQIQKLKDLSERLADAFIAEADPDDWPGAGMKPSEMTQEERGNRYWCKKDAAATATLLNKVITMQVRPESHISGILGASNDDDDQLDKLIKDAEKRGRAQLVKFQKRFANGAK
jgi:hypothetical protein